MRIAIASSGLGHIARGIESWAFDTARGLAAAGENVTLFQGGGCPVFAWQQRLECFQRGQYEADLWVRRLRRLGGWRFGMGSTYEVEQSTFAYRLWRAVRDNFDILHVQDPQIALILDRLHRLGLSRPRVILGHGTEEEAGLLRKFSILQHLAPCYLDAWIEQAPKHQRLYAVPNFVDTALFRPGDRAETRAEWDLPADALVVLCVAAIKAGHKRVDVLLREFAAALPALGPDAMLVIAGASDSRSTDIIEEGKRTLGDRVRFFAGLDRSRMPSLYQAADVFAIASLHEMMPIAVLEAMASGRPIVCNNTPVLTWMTGDAAAPSDIAAPNALAEQLVALRDPSVRALRGEHARHRAENLFSETVVLRQFRNMYSEVVA